MTEDLQETNVSVLQQRLLDEVSAQEKLIAELKTTLEAERNLRLENEVLWAYLGRHHPQRVVDAQDLLGRLLKGGDLLTELDNISQSSATKQIGLRKKFRRKIGSLPGVQPMYHRIKNIGK